MGDKGVAKAARYDFSSDARGVWARIGGDRSGLEVLDRRSNTPVLGAGDFPFSPFWQPSGWPLHGGTNHARLGYIAFGILCCCFFGLVSPWISESVVLNDWFLRQE